MRDVIQALSRSPWTYAAQWVALVGLGLMAVHKARGVTRKAPLALPR
jgi:hypothetical protein